MPRKSSLHSSARDVLGPSFCCQTVVLFGLAGRLFADTPAPPPAKVDLTQMSLEELMNVEVTSVSKTPERLSHAAASVTVITQDDILRSGSTSIPEALRLAPGMQVARANAHTWAISARGFNEIFANKLLVMVDGRSVYTPLFSGVFWDAQDVLLEDLDRIEVIRGPGAALWGANAVNGVINVMSKPARETQGGVVFGGGGTEERDFFGARYGAKLSDHVWMRVYGKYFERGDSLLPSGAEATDGMRMERGGFRLDWEPAVENSFTLQGDIYGGESRQAFAIVAPTPPLARVVFDEYSIAGGNVLGRWTHVFSDEADLRLQAYYDRTSRGAAIFNETRDTADVDLQQRLAVGTAHEFLAGLGYRASKDAIGNTFTLSFTPDHRTTHLFSAFLQDQISLVPDKVRLTLGARVEHNVFTGFEFQPSGRLLWTPGERHSIWAAVSRAVRSPSRVDDGVRINQPGPAPGTMVSLFGNTGFDSEVMTAYEIGYRAQPVERVAFDLSVFYNQYDRLRSAEPGPPIIGVPVILPFTTANNLKGETYGVETGPQIQLADWWRMQAKYSFLEVDLRRKPGSADTTLLGAEGNSPQQQFLLRSSMDFPHNVSFDATARYVDSLPNLKVPSFVSLDLRLAWRPCKNVEISVVGQNLLDNQHPEFAPGFFAAQATEVQRSVYGKLTWRF